MKHIYLLVITCILLSCNAQTSTAVKTITVATYSKKINATPNVQILDVRTPEEYATGHIANSNNVNWLNDTFAVEADKYNKKKPVFVYCRSGVRSLKAANKLAELGFTNIYNLDGGILKWEAEGMAKQQKNIPELVPKKN